MITKVLDAKQDRDLLERIYKYENEIFNDASVGKYNISPFAKYGKVYITYNEIDIVSVIEIINSFDNIAYIYGVSTNINYRNKGYAKTLLKKAITDLKESGINNFELTVSTNNIIGIKLYESLNFKIIQILDNEYFDNEKRYLMRLEI